MPTPTASPEFPSRRQLLQLGGLGAFGLGLPDILRAASNRTPGRARAVILLHQFGGPSQLDTLDPKPNAPDGIRGIYAPLRTSVPGVLMSERLPRLARLADRVTLVRTLRHEMKHHNSASYYSLTGHAPPFDDQRLKDSLNLYPAYGSVVDRLAPSGRGVPTFVALPHVLYDGSYTPGQHASFLGKRHNPLLCRRTFEAAGGGTGFALPELSLPEDVSLERLADRRSMMRLVDRQAAALESSTAARGFDATYDRAVAMMTSNTIRQAFDLSAEPAAVRDRYGRTTYGQSCLLARRLVEAGARFVNVYFAGSIGGQGNSGGWDTHGFGGKPMYPVLSDYLLPATDQTVPALLEDLDARGLLDETLVVWVGEFGRSPRINGMAGRDHWPGCYTALLAGGGVKRGFVHGVSDKTAAEPVSDPVGPEDLAATIFHQLGIAPDSMVQDTLKRPVPISTGSVIREILA